MSRRSIAELRVPQRRFRPDLAKEDAGKNPRFENQTAARQEDAKRAKNLHKSAETAKVASNAALARELAERLECGLAEDSSAQSLASALYMRDLRIRVGGALWKLAEDSCFGAPATFTAIGRGLEIPGRYLSSVDPRAVCAAFRSNLNRAGAKDATGYLAAFLDGEYEPLSDVFRLHFHGLVAGDMRDVLERLRTTRKYASSRDASAGERVVQHIRVSRRVLTNLPDPLTYLLKPFWPCRWEGDINGIQRRQGYRSRIPEPRHSQLLLWLDRWSLKDMTLLMGLRVGADGLIATKNPYTNGDDE